MNKLQGWLIIALLCLIPVVLWFLQPYPKFSDLPTILRSLGKVTGLIGMVLFALSFLLSTRWKRLESFFGGLNRVYIAHHILGGVAFILLLLHPVLLAGRYLATDIDRAFWLLLPNREASIYAWLSLGLLILILYVTFFYRLPYQLWRKIHLLSGPAFLFGVLHTYNLPATVTDVTKDLSLYIYMLVISGIGVAAYLYRLLMQTVVMNKLEYDVVEVKNLGDDVVEVVMKPLKKRLEYESGQFIYVTFYDPHAKRPNLEPHPFTITSSPDEHELKVVIKGLGDYTKKIQTLSEDTWALLEGPYGRFSFKNADYDRQIWIAGGIGITPFLSMARSLAKRDEKYKIDLFYACNKEEEAVFLNELKMIDRHYDNLRVFTKFADKEGFLTAEYIKQKCGDLKNAAVLLCGPPLMTKTLKEQFEKEGVSDRRFFSEEFGWF